MDGRSLDVRRRNLQRMFAVLLELRQQRLISTLDPREFTKTEIDALVSWTGTKSASYAAKLWTAMEDFLLFNGNDIVKRLEAKTQWRRPHPTYTPGPVKDEMWLREALSKLDTSEGWRAEATKFVVAFMFGTGMRPGELRLADVTDLDTQRWVFKVAHPKRVPGAVVGAELAVFADTRVHVLDYLAAREKNLRELGFDPDRVTALVPSERGRHYTEAGFRNVRLDTFKKLGIEGDYRTLRRTHEQILMDRLEAHDYREGSVIEISAKRLRHSMQTAVRHYADLRTARGQLAAQEAWEAPLVRMQDRAV
jgi:integrase